ncbi:hypothetical protein P152DRAFT_51930 [Eremomyces bilateralis CBS 781.70]|uniref:Endoplasmic reticulum protein n=1 Tax=Eremomyces bilateralis CBS 781.70 TaxID=1392243 RepID=A0A6G1G119_9PEZI|nr:uncharacterized protein P152DRAFT_51930 [Eremomyces bilateralis CBS 781.70]KAF1811807.1 hypothetical protein P152DRAFT_51930 [Eremomyces bilateralis CBS 781.70]
MAPSSPNEPLQARILNLAQSLQFGWFVGHAILLLSVLRYGFSYLTFNSASRWARFSYRTAFLSAVATYVIVVYKSAKAKAKREAQNKGSIQPLSFAFDENVHYLVWAVVLLFTRQVPLALLPFAIYSTFHVATYTRSQLLPVVFPSKAPTPAASGAAPRSEPPGYSALGNFIKAYYDPSMATVALLEIALIFRLAFSALLFVRLSWVTLIVYLLFFRMRYSQSQYIREGLAHIGARVDALVANQGTPPVARQVWEQTRGVLAKVVDVTDVRRYVSGPQAPKKEK